MFLLIVNFERVVLRADDFAREMGLDFVEAFLADRLCIHLCILYPPEV